MASSSFSSAHSEDSSLRGASAVLLSAVSKTIFLLEGKGISEKENEDRETEGDTDTQREKMKRKK